MRDVITPGDPRVAKLTRRAFRAYLLLLNPRIERELRAAGLLVGGEVIDAIYSQLGAAS
jgi:hypothetical protein